MSVCTGLRKDILRWNHFSREPQGRYFPWSATLCPRNRCQFLRELRVKRPGTGRYRESITFLLSENMEMMQTLSWWCPPLIKSSPIPPSPIIAGAYTFTGTFKGKYWNLDPADFLPTPACLEQEIQVTRCSTNKCITRNNREHLPVNKDQAHPICFCHKGSSL